MEFAWHLMYSSSVNAMIFITDPVRHHFVLHQRNVTPSKLPKLQTTLRLCIVLIFKSRPSCDWGKRPSTRPPLPNWASIRGPNTAESSSPLSKDCWQQRCYRNVYQSEFYYQLHYEALADDLKMSNMGRSSCRTSHNVNLTMGKYFRPSSYPLFAPTSK
jgi:hypothetical protein